MRATARPAFARKSEPREKQNCTRTINRHVRQDVFHSVLWTTRSAVSYIAWLDDLVRQGNFEPVRAKVIGTLTCGGVPGFRRASLNERTAIASRRASPVLWSIRTPVTLPVRATLRTTIPERGAGYSRQRILPHRQLMRTRASGADDPDHLTRQDRVACPTSAFAAFAPALLFARAAETLRRDEHCRAAHQESPRRGLRNRG